MPVNWDRKVASATRMLAKYGSERTLIKRTFSGDPARPVVTPVPHPCIGIEFDIETNQIDGKTVFVGDKLAYVSPALTVEAIKGDSFLDKAGVKWDIYKVDKLSPDGTVLLWTFWLRK